MKTEMMVALIAAAAAVVAAVASSIAAFLTSRLAAGSAERLERVKHELSRESDTDALSSKAFEEAWTSLELSLAALQRVRDELLLIGSTLDQGLDRDLAVARYSPAVVGLFEVYQQHQARLDDQERCALHAAKNLSHGMEVALRKLLGANPRAVEPLKEVVNRCENVRRELGDLQDTLRDSRIYRLHRRLAHGGHV